VSGTAGRPSRAQGRRSRSLLGRAATAVCAVVLVLLHAVAGYLLFVAYMSGVADPWERDAVIHSGIAAGLALVIAAVSTLLTWAFVKARRLCGWWYVLPAVLAVAALLRLTVLAPEL